MALTVYGRATSSNVQMVMWGLAELGLSAERLDYGHVHGGTDTPEFRAMNPNGLVPVLVDGDLAVFESAAILRYLAARYGDGGAFWPADPVARARIDMWAEWGKGTFARHLVMQIFWPRVRTAAALRDGRALAEALDRFEVYLDILAGQLDGGFVAGADFTLADVVIGHVLYRWFDIDVPRRPRPVVEDYYARLAERPGYRSHVMVSYDPLRAEGA